MKAFRILVINPGSTSTKIAVFDNDKSVFLKNINHLNKDLEEFNSIAEQFEFRKNTILNELVHANINIDSVSAVIGRGGLVKPIESGVYEVNELLKTDLKKGVLGQHASNLGGLIAEDIAKKIPGVKAFIADPVVVDEMEDIARISGNPDMPNCSIFHALNQKATGRIFAKTRGFVYEELNLIIAHMGGGISVGVHKQGRVIDVNNALNGCGPFSPERAGTLPARSLVDACYSGKYSYGEMTSMLNGKGGLMAHLNTNQAYEVVKSMNNGDKHAELILKAMCYQVGKSIGACAAVLKGKVNGIILTGGIVNSDFVVSYIRDMVDFIAPVAVYPGEDEMTALMQNALLVLRNKIKSKEYI